MSAIHELVECTLIYSLSSLWGRLTDSDIKDDLGGVFDNFKATLNGRDKIYIVISATVHEVPAFDVLIWEDEWD